MPITAARSGVRSLIRRDFDQVFAAGIDAILTPATPSAAFPLGALADADPIRMYLNDVFTVTANLAGLPGIAVPAALDSQGLPLALQLIGRPWDEAGILAIADQIERSAGFAARPRSLVVGPPPVAAAGRVMPSPHGGGAPHAAAWRPDGAARRGG
ncbi:MAG: hypothetical protein KatS3mg118_1353 [Paracoccaceae bacterium]|nr:MAG: hypothetical protein KatS3mg118_1353 [Paracoccaceae bacterium]